jgi:DNA-binding transcriptional MocR family regulator
LVESGTQALDLLCRYLLRPGDCVLIDDPGYFNFQALLRAHQVRMVGVPYGQDGPNLEALAAVLDRHRPRLYVTNSAVHNPTGATLSAAVAHRVLKLVEHFGTVVIEDDIFADFEQSAAVRLSGFDGLDRVIQIGSFSKTLSAAARCGFIAARPDWIEGLIELKIATSFGASRLNEGLVCRVLGHSGFRRHGESVRRRLEHARRDAAQRLGAMGVTSLIEPQAGMFLWCQLPQGRDAAVIARAALEQGVVLAPGNAFSLSQSHASSMRFNVAQMDDDIFGLIEQLLG